MLKLTLQNANYIRQKKIPNHLIVHVFQIDTTKARLRVRRKNICFRLVHHQNPTDPTLTCAHQIKRNKFTSVFYFQLSSFVT